MLVDGNLARSWQPVQATEAKGGFLRQISSFRSWVTPDGAAGQAVYDGDRRQKPPGDQRAPECRPGSRNGKGASAISIIAAVVAPAALALVACAAAYLAGRTSGLVRIFAQMGAVILASLIGALAGFLVPRLFAPDGGAFLAGVLATLGTIGGMTLAETLMARLDRS